VSEEILSSHELPKDKKYVAIRVNDNGIGFDQKYATTIFTLFQRLAYTKGIDGSGLGLAICKKIVEDHGGAIFANGKENEGASFTVILPI
jgi:signal transduction histidine kinase